jgi:hypothetical protein
MYKALIDGRTIAPGSSYQLVHTLNTSMINISASVANPTNAVPVLCSVRILNRNTVELWDLPQDVVVISIINLAQCVTLSPLLSRPNGNSEICKH